MDNQELRTNKQELINKYELIKNVFNFDVVATDDIISDLKRLDEPQKPVVPESVHKYIRKARECSWDFQDLFKYIDDEDSEELQKWFYHECNQETLAIAWINGYEIEEEKRYLVKVKNVLTRQGALNRNKKSGRFIFSNPEENSLYDTKFTREELEGAGFGWVFDCPGIEVEEVQE